MPYERRREGKGESGGREAYYPPMPFPTDIGGGED